MPDPAISRPQPRILIFAYEGEEFMDRMNMAELTAEKLSLHNKQAELKIVELPIDYKEIDRIF